MSQRSYNKKNEVLYLSSLPKVDQETLLIDKVMKVLPIKKTVQINQQAIIVERVDIASVSHYPSISLDLNVESELVRMHCDKELLEALFPEFFNSIPSQSIMEYDLLKSIVNDLLGAESHTMIGHQALKNIANCDIRRYKKLKEMSRTVMYNVTVADQPFMVSLEISKGLIQILEGKQGVNYNEAPSFDVAYKRYGYCTRLSVNQYRELEVGDALIIDPARMSEEIYYINAKSMFIQEVKGGIKPLEQPAHICIDKEEPYLNIYYEKSTGGDKGSGDKSWVYLFAPEKGLIGTGERVVNKGKAYIFISNIFNKQ